MGNRVTVSISGKDHEAPVNIYGHWAGDGVYQIVTDTLAASQRIGDGSYLTAQLIHAIFSEMGYNGKDSFGVWSGEVSSDNWDDNQPMFVDADTGQWRIGDSKWNDKGTPLEDVYLCECEDCRAEMGVAL
jgi:hypothetical protein